VLKTEEFGAKNMRQ